MNILFPEIPKEWLTTAVTEVNGLLVDNCIKYNTEARNVYVATWLEIKNKFETLKKVIEEGFAYSTHYYHINDFVSLIIINEENCNVASINNLELKAIILHELGHLLNHPLQENIPSIMNCLKNNVQYNKDEETRIIKLNDLNGEIFADAYAKQNGYSKHLLESFIKYNNWSGKDVGYYNERVEAVNKHVGTIKPINRQGF